MTGSATYPDLEGRSVFISGGGSGIGAQIVRRFCEQGSKVAFVDIDSACADGAGGDAWRARGWPGPCSSSATCATSRLCAQR